MPITLSKNEKICSLDAVTGGTVTHADSPEYCQNVHARSSVDISNALSAVPKTRSKVQPLRCAADSYRFTMSVRRDSASCWMASSESSHAGVLPTDAKKSS